jgi:hypothetical protein
VRAAQFTGGGSLDGAELQLPAHVAGVVTVDRGGRSYYVLDDQAEAYHFTGFDETGATMAGLWRELTGAARREAEAIAAASAPQGCSRCGRTFATPAARQIGHENGQCLPDTAFGQLVLLDGVWCEAWRHPGAARR